VYLAAFAERLKLDRIFDNLGDGVSGKFSSKDCLLI
jgi:hypothetical protein